MLLDNLAEEEELEDTIADDEDRAVEADELDTVELVEEELLLEEDANEEEEDEAVSGFGGSGSFPSQTRSFVMVLNGPPGPHSGASSSIAFRVVQSAS